MASIELTAVSAISDIAKDAWDACASGSLAALPANPFMSYDFFNCLEESGSAAPKAGWLPRHLVAKRGEKIIGIVPCYLKSHSQGEYVFDHGWAEAFARAGGDYYPKLQAAVPFTPVTGPRLLVHPEEDKSTTQAILANGLVALCKTVEASSVHVTFAQEDEWQALGEQGFLQRTDRQFHWLNDNYQTFDDFLSVLNARHRKAIRRERRDALAADGITIHWLTGSDITEDAWDAFFAFYIETGSRKWGRPYLNRLYYALIGERMAHRILLVMVKREGRWIAGAINFIGSDALYGRNWGAIEHHPFLHFEVCYYQAIEYAIAHKLKRVEAGAQGEHKIARGYMPTPTYSAHYIEHPGLRRAVRDYLDHERAYVAAADDELRTLAPFRHDADGD